ncbi:putative histidine triad (HIT) protein [Dioscorea sansibarensis]
MLSLARSLLLLPLPKNSALTALALDRRLRCPRSSLYRPLCARPEMEPEPEAYRFGPYKINCSEVFFRTELSFAFVNLRPVVPVKRFVDLTADETTDLWLIAKKIGDQLESYHKASSLTFTIQDGPQAGQTVPHVHIHILPRKTGDFANNDEIYDAIDKEEKELKKKLDLDEERKDRTADEMAREADNYRVLFS